MKRHGIHPAALILLSSLLLPIKAMAIPVSGRALDSGGDPIPRVKVELIPLLASFERHVLELEGHGEPPAVAETWSDSLGFFILEAPYAGMWKALASAPGHLPVEIDLLPLITPLDLPEVRLTAGAPVAVRVVSTSGHPVEGARLRIDVAVDVTDSPAPGWRSAPRWAVSGPDGRLSIPRTRNESLRLRAVASDFLPAEVSWSDSEPLEVSLARGRRQQILTRGPDGEPLPGVVVQDTSDRLLGRTDEAGRLTLTVPPDQDTALILEAADGSRGRGLLPARPPNGSDPADAVPFVIPPALRLTGKVLSGLDDRGLEGALVWPVEWPEAWRRTGKGGQYTLDIPTDGPVPPWVAAAALEHMPAAESLPFETGAVVPTLVLAPASTLSGRVLDEDGQPIAEARIHLSRMDVPPRPDDLLALSDGAGRFYYRLLPPSQAYALRATASGFAPRSVTVAELEPLVERGVEIVLHRGRAAHGRVLDSDEQPLSGAVVRLLKTLAGNESSPAGGTVGADALKRMQTDADGRFAAQHLAVGLYELRVEAPGFAPLTVGGLAIRPGTDSFDLGRFVLVPGESLHGIVVDPQDRGIAGVVVEVLPSGPTDQRLARAGDLSIRSTTTGAGGEFELPDLKRGEAFTLRVRGQGYAPETLPRVEAPRVEPLRVVLQRSARVSGRVLDEEGVGVGRGRIVLLKDDGEILGGAMLAEDGRFTAEDIRPGRFQAMALAPGYLEGVQADLEVLDGDEITDVEIVLSRGAVLEGRVLGPEDRGVAGARVWLTGKASAPGLPVYGDPPETISDSDGHYLLTGISEGGHTLIVEHAEYARVHQEVEVRGRRRLDLRLDRGWQVVGRIVDQARSPLPGSRIRLHSDQGAYEETSDGGGIFRFTGVAGGSYRLEAEKAGFAPTRWRDEIRIDLDVEGLEVELGRGGTIAGRILGIEPEELGNLRILARNGLGHQMGRVLVTGEYRIENLPSGDWSVAAHLPGSGREARGQVSLGPSDDEAVLDLRFGEGLTLEGRLLRVGEPVTGAGISLRSVETDFSSVLVSDHEGRFKAEGLTHGIYDVTVIRRGRLIHRTTLELDTSREVVFEVPVETGRGEADQSRTAGG